jgi:hypothetical protein
VNPYLTILLDLVALMETPQFAQLTADIQAAEGGAGTGIKNPTAAATVRQMIQAQGAQPAQPKPAQVPTPTPTVRGPAVRNRE